MDVTSSSITLVFDRISLKVRPCIKLLSHEYSSSVTKWHADRSRAAQTAALLAQSEQERASPTQSRLPMPDSC